MVIQVILTSLIQTPVYGRRSAHPEKNRLCIMEGRQHGAAPRPGHRRAAGRRAHQPDQRTSVRSPVARISIHSDLWFIPADECQLTDGWVYHYWFEVSDGRRCGRPGLEDPHHGAPTAYTVNWQLLAIKPDDPLTITPTTMPIPPRSD